MKNKYTGLSVKKEENKGKKMKNVFKLILAFLVMTFASCYAPSPLYGTWADNDGNKLSLVSDGTFVSKIIDSDGASITYEGDYNIIDNVIVFSTSEGLVINSEWDVRGSVLYLTWTSNNETKNLSLYHTSK